MVALRGVLLLEVPSAIRLKFEFSPLSYLVRLGLCVPDNVLFLEIAWVAIQGPPFLTHLRELRSPFQCDT